MDQEVIRAALQRLGEPGPPRIELLAPEHAAPRRLGILSGSFDPMTIAHAALADALEDDGADLVLFLYSVRTLPKEGATDRSAPPLLDQEDRVAALLAYCGDRPRRGVAMCSHGLYADQAEAVAAAYPEAELVFGVGSDKVMQLFDARWYDDRNAALERLFSFASLAYATRGGDEERLRATLRGQDQWHSAMRRLSLPAEVAGVSSRAIRQSLRAGEEISDLVPAAVLPVVLRAARD
ncbi:MAG: hypothetical protein ACRDH6_05570 [Actinomycetota bacterium]